MKRQDLIRSLRNFSPDDTLERVAAADALEADEALLRQALEALEFEYGGEPCGTHEAITALRARLEGK
jgi:hypothetical protein